MICDPLGRRSARLFRFSFAVPVMALLLVLLPFFVLSALTSLLPA